MFHRAIIIAIIEPKNKKLPPIHQMSGMLRLHIHQNRLLLTRKERD
jgi:hypothetical protein